jgi:dTDP-4-amino-4,6-dideoxygalactose transaminase
MDKRKNYILFGAPLIGKEEINEVLDTIHSGWLGTGPKVKKFEDAFNSYAGTREAVALNSCTAGLHLSLIAAGVGTGDEVITTPLTFCATANAIIHNGAKPVFVDVNLETMNIDEHRIEKAITKRTKVIIPVHMAGRPCEMDAIRKIAKKYKLAVIEDAAHAIGAEYKGKKIGGISDFTVFSFYVTKNITTIEGGMITTNKTSLIPKIRAYSLHGMSQDAWKRYSDSGDRKHYNVIYPGFKYNMTVIQASFGIHQLAKIEVFNKRREEIWNRYNEAFKNLPVVLPAPIPSHIKHARHLYTMLIDKKVAGIDRDTFMHKLNMEAIGSSVHFQPVHLFDYYRKAFGYSKGDYPNAEYIGERTVSIQLSAKLSEEEIARIIKAVKEAFK